MIAVFLYFNALLYAVFAAWCTFAPRRTAEAMGYSSVSASGQSEYLVVYGGLQLGLGLFFLYCARTGEDRLVAILAGRQHHAGDRRPGTGAAAGQHRFVVGAHWPCLRSRGLDGATLLSGTSRVQHVATIGPIAIGGRDGMTETMTADTAVDALAEAIAAVASGDRAAFERLYRATSSKLFGVCLRVLPDRDEAEDVLQEVYATVWRKAAQFDASRASAVTWLAMIARNKAIDRLRANPSSARTAPIEWADNVADPAPSPLHVTESAVENTRLNLCMEQLEGRRRSLIRTAFFDGATYEELAARIGSPLGSVKSWIRRGLQQLRACLEQ